MRRAAIAMMAGLLAGCTPSASSAIARVDGGGSPSNPAQPLGQIELTVGALDWVTSTASAATGWAASAPLAIATPSLQSASEVR